MPAKTLPPKLTARQFCRACLLFGDIAPGEVSSLFHRRSLPKWSDVATVAEDYACEITASEHTAPAHIRLMEVFEWAKEMAKA